MKFNPTADTPSDKPKSDFANILPPGNYAFSILDASDYLCASGKDAIKLKLGIDRPDNRGQQWVWHYAMADRPDKILALCTSIGMEDVFNDGEIQPADLIGRRGTCRLKIEQAKGQYPEKNVIAEFLPPSESVNAVNAVTPQDDQPPANNDEEIPF